MIFGGVHKEDSKITISKQILSIRAENRRRFVRAANYTSLRFEQNFLLKRSLLIF